MKLSFIIFFFLIEFSYVAGQKWEPVSEKIQQFHFRDSSMCPENFAYRKGNKLIFIDNLAEKDFINLFTEDSSAFDLIYDASARVPFMLLYDSSFSTLLNIDQREDVVFFYNRKVEIKKDTVIWHIMSRSDRSPGCYGTIILRRDRQSKTFFLKVLDITGYCLIP